MKTILSREQNSSLKVSLDMTTGNESRTLYVEKSNIGFEFFVSTDTPYNFIHPDTLNYWMIEPPVVSDWNVPFSFTLSPGSIKPTFPCQGVEKLSRELVKCPDGIFRTCAKVTVQVICHGYPHDLEFYVDKTLQHAGIIGTDFGNIKKRKE